MTHPGRQARLDAADAAVVLKTRKMLTQNGLDGEARRMGSHLSRVQGLPTVVVVGEVRRGQDKSGQRARRRRGQPARAPDRIGGGRGCGSPRARRCLSARRNWSTPTGASSVH